MTWKLPRLNPNEAKILRVLRIERWGGMTGQQIADNLADLNRGSVYSALKRMQGKGLVSSTGQRKARYYQVTPAGIEYEAQHQQLRRERTREL